MTNIRKLLLNSDISLNGGYLHFEIFAFGVVTCINFGGILGSLIVDKKSLDLVPADYLFIQTGKKEIKLPQIYLWKLS